ncbi:unnamed protein product [Amoebophrya sp. A120]|nr:unnamed protein product [Amoebophrya sp. A120]|eukprot:GSA120T00003813001.1
MAGTGQGYDLSVTTYSPDGRIFQIDYAQKCVDSSPTCLAMICKDGVVLASQKLKLSKMLVHGTNRRAYAISKTSGCVVCGMVPEGRNVVARARQEAQSYKKNYGEVVPGYLLAERLGFYMHHYTLYASLRPIGSAVLLASYDESPSNPKVKVPTLFSVEPNGLVQKWFGRAMGKGRQLANTEIEKLDLKTLTVKESLFHIARIFHKVHDESKAFEIEVNWICEGSKWQHEVVPAALIAEAEEAAKKAIEDEDE